MLRGIYFTETLVVSDLPSYQILLGGTAFLFLLHYSPSFQSRSFNLPLLHQPIHHFLNREPDEKTGFPPHKTCKRLSTAMDFPAWKISADFHREAWRCNCDAIDASVRRRLPRWPGSFPQKSDPCNRSAIGERTMGGFPASFQMGGACAGPPR